MKAANGSKKNGDSTVLEHSALGDHIDGKTLELETMSADDEKNL